MNVKKNYDLKPHNTFQFEVKAKQFVEITSLNELKEIAKHINAYDLKYLVLGGGSNVLFTQDFDGLVLFMNIKGKEIVRQNDNKVLLKVSAGEVWHDWVMWTLENGFYGLENLALIPGSVGAAPIQNIGAYGVEVKDVIECVEVLNMETLKTQKIVNSECDFGYRDSFFKQNKGKYIITAINVQLHKNSEKVNVEYGNISTQLTENGILNPTPIDVAQAVIKIRQEKLPDPKLLGNAGSFFKNSVISVAQFEKLKSKFPDIKGFVVDEKQMKVPTAWLIQQAGFKGVKIGNVGVHEIQPLVMVNHGKGSGEEVLQLAKTIQQKVFEMFGIEIVPEVNIV